MPAGTYWEMYFLRIFKGTVLVVLHTTIKKGLNIIPIRVNDSGNSDISRDETRMWPIDVIGDNDDLELKRFMASLAFYGKPKYFTCAMNAA
jgi:hypothetical protein